MNIKWILPSMLTIFYACTVMYLLLDVQWATLSKKRKLWSIVYFIVFCAMNVTAQVSLGYALYGKYYLLLTQLPVFFFFLLISNYKGIKLFFVLLTAVFFAAPVMFVTTIFKSFMIPPLWLYFASYLLMLLLIQRFFKDAFNYMLATAENSVFIVFTAVPLLYYIYSYSLTGYQLADMVINKRYFILNLPLLLVLLSYILLVRIFKMVSEKAELENAQNLANVQLNAAAEQLEQLRTAERQSAIYRHDLRHHMNYLNACIAENRLQEAVEYIKQTCNDVDNMMLERYSENEPVNLILSSYVGKAREQGIAIETTVTATNFSRFYITDLCSLFANALENAIKAAGQAQCANQRYVTMRLYERSNRLCMELCNGCTGRPVFKNGLPVSQKKGHGIGVKSIVQVVEKYKGVYLFTAKEDEFCFQMSM